MIARLAGLALLLLAALAPAKDVAAHALEPGYLEIAPLVGDTVRVTWRKPAVQGRPMAIEARLPDACDQPSPPEPSFDGRAWVAGWATTCPGGLRGETITIDGLEATRTDVLVRYDLGQGAQTARLTPDRTGFVIPPDPDAWTVMRDYLPLGVDHILRGLDHLLFVFALLLLIPDLRRLVGAITAFTIAHSLTMAGATLGLIALPGPPVEAVIALSIMFLAAELTHPADSGDRLSQRKPWLVSFGFGLLHGFGFAGALREIGLPQTDIPLALLAFNLGVEIGQILFVVAILLTGAALRAVAPALVSALRRPGSQGARIAAYAIGSAAAIWFVDRVAGLVA